MLHIKVLCRYTNTLFVYVHNKSKVNCLTTYYKNKTASGFAQCVNQESSSERRNYIRTEQTDLYAYAKYLIQSGRI